MMNLFRKTVVMDVNILPAEYKQGDRSLKENIAAYEHDFNVKLIPIDGSKLNSLGVAPIVNVI